MNLQQRIMSKQVAKLSKQQPPELLTVPKQQSEEPFLLFPCEKCKEQVTLQDSLQPGQAAVITCDNCGASWTILLPSLQIYDTAKFEQVWRYTANGDGNANIQDTSASGA